MRQILVNYYYCLGRVLESADDVLFLPEALTATQWSSLLNAKEWLEQLVNDKENIRSMRRCRVVGKELLDLIEPLTKEAKPRRLTQEEDNNIREAISKFHHEMESESKDLHVYLIEEKGAYSLDALIANAEKHLSHKAEQTVSDRQLQDFRAAGQCLALDLYTACGFHAMRALEEETRIYHEVVTGVCLSDAPLGAVINGDSKVAGSGLEPQHVREGSKPNSPLGLIISMLRHINKIYRCPIMHPEMTLDYETAKQVFDLSAIAISAIAEDAIERLKQQRQQQQQLPMATATSGTTGP